MASITWSADCSAVGKSSTKGTSRASSCLASRYAHESAACPRREREPAGLGRGQTTASTRRADGDAREGGGYLENSGSANKKEISAPQCCSGVTLTTNSHGMHIEGEKDSKSPRSREIRRLPGIGRSWAVLDNRRSVGSRIGTSGGLRPNRHPHYCRDRQQPTPSFPCLEDGLGKLHFIIILISTDLIAGQWGKLLHRPT
jgi:hypothetical protein